MKTTRVSDAFGLPRNPDTAIHLFVGEWEFKSVWTLEDLTDALERGWKIVYTTQTHVTVKYTHNEQCGCGKEANHG